MKVALVCPEATLMVAGTVRLALLLESATVNPPLGAAPVNPTEQDVLPGVFMVALVQLRLLKESALPGRETAPDAPLEVIEVPLAVVATTLVSCIKIGLLEGFAAI